MADGYTTLATAILRQAVVDYIDDHFTDWLRDRFGEWLFEQDHFTE